MTVASWHRGESCSPGRRQSGAESGLSFPRDPRWDPQGCDPGPAPPPAGLPAVQPRSRPRRLHSQLGESWDASRAAAGPSSRSLAGPARAGAGKEVSEGAGDPSLPSPPR